MKDNSKILGFNDFLKQKYGYEHWYVKNVPVKRLDEFGSHRINKKDYARLEDEYELFKKTQSIKDGGQIKEGIAVEREHRDLYLKLKKDLEAKGCKMPMGETEFYRYIAKRHDKESKKYYKLLAEMEQKFKAGGNISKEAERQSDKLDKKWKDYLSKYGVDEKSKLLQRQLFDYNKNNFPVILRNIKGVDYLSQKPYDYWVIDFSNISSWADQDIFMDIVNGRYTPNENGKLINIRYSRGGGSAFLEFDGSMLNEAKKMIENAGYKVEIDYNNKNFMQSGGQIIAYRYGKINSGDVEFFSRDKDYAEEYAKLKGGTPSDVSKVEFIAKNPLIIELPSNQFSSSEYENPYIEQAITQGNDVVIFKDENNELEFYARIKNKKKSKINFWNMPVKDFWNLEL